MSGLQYCLAVDASDIFEIILSTGELCQSAREVFLPYSFLLLQSLSSEEWEFIFMVGKCIVIDKINIL